MRVKLYGWDIRSQRTGTRRWWPRFRRLRSSTERGWPGAAPLLMRGFDLLFMRRYVTWRKYK